MLMPCRRNVWISRVLYTYHQFHDDGKFLLVDFRVFISLFLNAYVESYPAQIWVFILDVKHNVKGYLLVQGSSSPLISCMSCSFPWNSQTIVAGL